MATQGLFNLLGATPEEIRSKYEQGLMGAPISSVPLESRPAAMGAGLGRQLGYSIGRMLGGRLPGEAEAEEQQAALAEAQQSGLSGSALFNRLADISTDPRRAFALRQQAAQMAASEAEAARKSRLDALNYKKIQLEVNEKEQALANRPDALGRFQKLVGLNEGTGKYTTEQLAIFANDPKETENAVKELMKRPEGVKLTAKQALAAKSLGLPVLNNVNEYTSEDAEAIRKAVLKREKEIAEAGGQKQLSSYAKKVGEDLAERDMVLIDQVQKAPATVKKLYTVLDLLEKGDINTGFAAKLKTKIESAIVKFTEDKDMGKRVSDTQYLETLLGGDVFPLIGALGIGARGLDTPAERDFLLKVMTGEVGLEIDTLKQMTKFRLEAVENSVSDFNNKVEEGYFKDFLSVAPNRKSLIKPITIPVRPKAAPSPAAPAAGGRKPLSAF